FVCCACSAVSLAAAVFIRRGAAGYSKMDRARRPPRSPPMLALSPTPLVRLGNLFPRLEVFAKCEFLAPSGCFKIRGAAHLLEHLTRQGGNRRLVVPSMGNTALGAATAAKALGFAMTGVVPRAISRAKDE